MFFVGETPWNRPAIQFIIHDFVSHPCRAKPRNITIFMNNSDEEEHEVSDDD